MHNKRAHSQEETLEHTRNKTQESEVYLAAVQIEASWRNFAKKLL